MTTPAPNHLHIYRDKTGKHATLDGRELLLDGTDGLLITGAENPDEVTRVMITLLSPKITIESELTDQEEEPTPDAAPGAVGGPDSTGDGREDAFIMDARLLTTDLPLLTEEWAREYRINGGEWNPGDWFSSKDEALAEPVQMWMPEGLTIEHRLVHRLVSASEEVTA